MESAMNFAHYLLYPVIVAVITIVSDWYCLQRRDWLILTKLVQGWHYKAKVFSFMNYKGGVLYLMSFFSSGIFQPQKALG
jgi:hypothetical protein